jgi:hypothetical protein
MGMPQPRRFGAVEEAAPDGSADSKVVIRSVSARR